MNIIRQNKHNAVILLYHGITNAKSKGIENYSGKHLYVDEFEKQLKFLHKNHWIMRFNELINCIKKKIPFLPRSVVITFDDAFENIYTQAFPLLKKYNIPITLFLSTAFVETHKMFWVDELENTINAQGWTYQEKLRFIIQAKKYLKNLSEEERQKYLDCMKIESHRTAPNYRKLTWGQIKEMVGSGLVELGGHTHTHCRLSATKDLFNEIRRPKLEIEKHLGIKINTFSYPEGQEGDYDQRVIDALVKEGYIASPTAIPGVNSLNTSLFHLRRIMVGFEGQLFPLKTPRECILRER